MRDVALFKVSKLKPAATGGRRTSTVGEPSAANSGRHVFFTGNWYAARSSDHGNTWTHIDPFAFLPSVDGGFCCDQTVIHDPGRDLTIWLLQYIVENGTNTLRIAVKSGRLDQGNWSWWDLVPKKVDASWNGEWFDYNHAAVTNDFLHVGTNVFKVGANTWTRAALFRIPLDVLASNGSLTYDLFSTTQNGSLRCVQGATRTMYFASHNGQSELRLFEWPDNTASVTSRDVAVTAWNRNPMPYSAPGPGGTDWLGRCDQRITGAWLADGIAGFMWTANRQGSARPLPYVRVVRIDVGAAAVVDEPDIWSSSTAYAYPETSPNVQGVVGVTLFSGGGSRHPTHMVGFRDEATSAWKLKSVVASSHGPTDGKWGDYLTCRRHSPDGLGWVAAGFTLQGGGGRSNVEPVHVHFGIQQHQPAADRWRGA